jgi:hypothetical protein
METSEFHSLAGTIVRQCGTCRFYEADPVDPRTLQSVKRCRRFPPSVTTLPAPQGLMQVSAWPNPHAEAWCYEWSPQPSKIVD